MKTKIFLTSLYLSTALCTFLPSAWAMEEEDFAFDKDKNFQKPFASSNQSQTNDNEDESNKGKDEKNSSAKIDLRLTDPSNSPLTLIRNPLPIKSKKISLILSIDGGGIRGLIPATMLKYLEDTVFLEAKRHMPKEAPEIPLACFGDLFDVIAGTSTGGIIAAGMRARSQMKAEGMKPGMQGLIDLYETQGHIIFTPKAKGLISGFVSPLTSNKYMATPLEALLETYFGNLTLKDLPASTLITTYDLLNEILYVFNSVDAKTDSVHNFKVKDATRATSAAPTYFPAVVISNEAGEKKTFVDGGVTANNPTQLAYLEAQKLYPHHKFYVVSLGCGVVPLFTDQNREGGGLLQWAPDIFSVASNSSSRMTEDLMSKSTELRKDGYERIQFDLAEKVKDMDSTGERHIQFLKGYAKRAIDDKNHKIHKVRDFILEQLEANNWFVYLTLASRIDSQIEEGQELLDLKNAHLTDRAFWEIKKKLLETNHGFRSLCLQGNVLTPSMATSLGDLPMMTALDLRNTQITQDIFKELKSSFLSLKNLKEINLKDNPALHTIDPSSLLNLITNEDKYDAYTLSFDEEVWHKLGQYMHGVHNFKGAVYFYEQGTTALTQIALAELYLMSKHGDESTQTDAFKKGLTLCKDFANKGEKKAQFLMGSFFEKALTQSTMKQYLIEENLISAQEDLNQKAAYYYKLAADQQHKRAAFLLAEMYFSNKVIAPFYGEGRNQKALHQLQETLKYYQIAAKAGSQTAQKKISVVEKEIQKLKEQK